MKVETVQDVLDEWNKYIKKSKGKNIMMPMYLNKSNGIPTLVNSNGSNSISCTVNAPSASIGEAIDEVRTPSDEYIVTYYKKGDFDRVLRDNGKLGNALEKVKKYGWNIKATDEDDALKKFKLEYPTKDNEYIIIKVEKSMNESGNKSDIINNIISEYKTDSIPYGSMYILPDGTLLDLGNTGYGHSDLSQYLNEVGLEIGYKLGSASNYLRTLGWIRVNTHLRFIDLVGIKSITDSQYSKLKDAIKFMNNDIQVTVESDYKVYKDQDPEYIIDRIKKYYTYGKLYESSSNTDILDKVENHFGTTNTPYNGPTFIMPDGKFLDLRNYSHHSAVEKWLIINGLSDEKFIATAGSPTLINLGCIRCDTVKYYIHLPKNSITQEQCNTLLVWLDYLSKYCSMVEVYTPDDLDSVVYRFSDEVISDYIVDRIRRYYSSGKLYENQITQKHQFNYMYNRLPVGNKISMSDKKYKFNEASNENITLDIMKSNLNYCRTHANDLFNNLNLDCEWDVITNSIHILVRFNDNIRISDLDPKGLYPYPLDIVIPYDASPVIIYNSKKSVYEPDMSTEDVDEDSSLRYDIWASDNNNQSLALALRDLLSELDDKLSDMVSTNDDIEFDSSTETLVEESDDVDWYMDKYQVSIFRDKDGNNLYEESDVELAQQWWDEHNRGN